jgi:drug/metabolite transporter (DMT)-like permease
MTNSLLVAVLAGLGGMLGWGFADFFAKKTIDRIGEVISLVWAHLLGASVFILVALCQFAVTGNGIHIAVKFTTWLGLAFFGALQMIVYWLVYKGFSKGQLAVLNPVFASYAGLVAIISIAFFGERLDARILIALITVFIGVILLNSDVDSLRKRRLNIVPGLKEIVLATLLAAVWTMGWGKFVSGHDSLSYALFMYLSMTAAAVILAKAVRVKLSGVKPEVWKFLLLIGLGEVVAYLAISIGFSKTSHVSIVALISGSFSVPAVILAHVFLKERISQLQMLAIAVILLGVGLISISS